MTTLQLIGGLVLLAVVIIMTLVLLLGSFGYHILIVRAPKKFLDNTDDWFSDDDLQ